MELLVLLNTAEASKVITSSNIDDFDDAPVDPTEVVQSGVVEPGQDLIANGSLSDILVQSVFAVPAH